MAVVIALSVGPVNLIIEVSHKLVMGSDQHSPRARALEVPVGHPPHHIDYVEFPKSPSARF